MKNYLIWISSISIIALFLFLFFFARISPGEVGVVVDLFGSKKGVEEAELTVGYHFIPPTKSLYRFPIFEQNHQWTGDDGFNFQTSEGLSVHSEIGITFNLIPTKIHELFCKYRRGMEEITDLFIKNHIRDAINRAASKLTIEQLYGASKDGFFNNVLSEVRRELDPLGLHISNVYLIGQLVVPQIVIDALNMKITAIQRAQQKENELRESEAEALKEVAKAKGIADARMLHANAEASANNLISKSITKDLLQWQGIQKWDGKMPSVMSGNGMPFILNLGDR